jgi:hypothetical protein
MEIYDIVNCVVSGIRREADQNCAVMGYYAANIGNFLLTFRDNLSVPSSRVLTLEDYPLHNYLE